MIIEKPEAILINIPEGYFKHDFALENEHKNDANKWKIADYMQAREDAFRRFYETMGQRASDDCFYHFISAIPTHEVTIAYVCFRGFVQYRAIIVEFLRNQPVMLPTYQHPIARNWVVTTGPVIKAPSGIIQKGFRGFRYSNKLF